MDELFINQVISNNYQEAQNYFPRLSKYLMNILANTKPEKVCQVVNYRNVEMFLYYLCAVIEAKSTYTDAFNYLQSQLTDEELINKNYLDFKDGYLYDKHFNQNYFLATIQESAVDLVMFFLEVEQGSVFDFDIFKNSVNKILTNQLKNSNIQEDIYSNEYIELTYMQNVLNALENLDEFVKVLQSNLN